MIFATFLDLLQNVSEKFPLRDAKQGSSPTSGAPRLIDRGYRGWGALPRGPWRAPTMFSRVISSNRLARRNPVCPRHRACLAHRRRTIRPCPHGIAYSSPEPSSSAFLRRQKVRRLWRCYRAVGLDKREPIVLL